MVLFIAGKIFLNTILVLNPLVSMHTLAAWCWHTHSLCFFSLSFWGTVLATLVCVIVSWNSLDQFREHWCLCTAGSFVNFCVLDDGLVGCWLIPVLECRIMNRVRGQCHDLIECQSCIPLCAFSILAAPFMWCQTSTYEGYYFADFFNSLVMLLLYCKILLKLIIFTAPYFVIFLV